MPDCAHIYDLDVATVPESDNPQSVGLDCCEQFNFLASTTSTSVDQNDVFMAVDRRASATDTMEFTIKKCGGAVLPNLGEELLTPQDTLAVGYMFDLRQYLATYFAGIYIIEKNQTFLGTSRSTEYARLRIWEYSDYKAKGTVRINSTFRNKSNIGKSKFVDFSGSNANSMLRLEGSFGKWKAQTENKILVDNEYNSIVTSSINKDKFTLEVDPASFMYANRLINLHLFAGVQHSITDYNDNHRKYTEEEVQFISESLDQGDQRIKPTITADFSKQKVDSISRYNQG